MPLPALERKSEGSLAWHTDPALLDRDGILVAFSERTGGVSAPPFASLDLAGHTGDEPASVDENRRRFLSALGLGRDLDRLTCAEQVHGECVAEVGPAEAGAGGSIVSGSLPVPGADALITTVPDTPLLLCFADCVPVMLVATAPVRAVAVVHAGWRGALAGLPGTAARALADRTGCDASSLLAYVGPHICRDRYEVGTDLASRFADSFGTIVAAQGRVDLGAVVSESLRVSGVPAERIATLGVCTAEQTGRFFSYRTEGVTGRHGALAAILQGRG